jgi:hypothetical protein
MWVMFLAPTSAAQSPKASAKEQLKVTGLESVVVGVE